MCVLAAPWYTDVYNLFSSATLVPHSIADRTYNLIQPLALVYFRFYSDHICPISYSGDDKVYLGRLLHITSSETDSEELLRLDLAEQRAYITLPPGTLVGGKVLNQDKLHFGINTCLLCIRYNTQFRNHLLILVDVYLSERYPRTISPFSVDYFNAVQSGDILENKLFHIAKTLKHRTRYDFSYELASLGL